MRKVGAQPLAELLRIDVQVTSEIGSTHGGDLPRRSPGRTYRSFTRIDSAHPHPDVAAGGPIWRPPRSSEADARGRDDRPRISSFGQGRGSRRLSKMVIAVIEGPDLVIVLVILLLVFGG